MLNDLTPLQPVRHAASSASQLQPSSTHHQHPSFLAQYSYASHHFHPTESHLPRHNSSAPLRATLQHQHHSQPSQPSQSSQPSQPQPYSSPSALNHPLHHFLNSAPPLAAAPLATKRHQPPPSHHLAAASHSDHPRPPAPLAPSASSLPHPHSALPSSSLHPSRALSQHAALSQHSLPPHKQRSILQPPVSYAPNQHSMHYPPSFSSSLLHAPSHQYASQQQPQHLHNRSMSQQQHQLQQQQLQQHQHQQQHQQQPLQQQPRQQQPHQQKQQQHQQRQHQQHQLQQLRQRQKELEQQHQRQQHQLQQRQSRYHQQRLHSAKHPSLPHNASHSQNSVPLPALASANSKTPIDVDVAEDIMSFGAIPRTNRSDVPTIPSAAFASEPLQTQQDQSVMAIDALLPEAEQDPLSINQFSMPLHLDRSVMPSSAPEPISRQTHSFVNNQSTMHSQQQPSNALLTQSTRQMPYAAHSSALPSTHVFMQPASSAAPFHFKVPSKQSAQSQTQLPAHHISLSSISPPHSSPADAHKVSPSQHRMYQPSQTQPQKQRTISRLHRNHPHLHSPHNAESQPRALTQVQPMPQAQSQPQSQSHAHRYQQPEPLVPQKHVHPRPQSSAAVQPRAPSRQQPQQSQHTVPLSTNDGGSRRASAAPNQISIQDLTKPNVEHRVEGPLTENHYSPVSPAFSSVTISPTAVMQTSQPPASALPTNSPSALAPATNAVGTVGNGGESPTSVAPSSGLSCVICKTPFTRRYNLKVHMSSKHSARRDYHCPHCENSFNRGDSLKRHIATTHRGEKKWSCPHCQRNFGQRPHMKMHVDTVHLKKRDHKCHCGKAFGTRYNLTAHQRTHEQTPKKHVCQVCRKSFALKSSLARHQRNSDHIPVEGSNAAASNARAPD